MSKTEELNFLNDLIDQVLVIDKSKTICFANLNAKKRFGENILDQNISSIIRDPELLDNIQKSLNDKSSSTIDVETKKPNYQYYKVSVMPGPKNIFNAEETVIIFFKDFTDIIKVQKLKSDFVANVSHELRTPLQSIKMGLETINDGAVKNDKENQKKIMPLIMQQAARMENIVNDLLSLSRIELQEHIRPNDNVVLDEIIKHSVDLHKDLLQKNNITCKIETENKNTEFKGDRNRLTEVFNNLIDNAIKYSEKNTKINILVKTNENNIDVIIKDQGIGIPREHIPKVTERFFRVNPEKSKEVGGTGLGLAIVKHIVNQHRGEIDISSEEGNGTQISLNFPKN